jgi:hypothetical protein
LRSPLAGYRPDPRTYSPNNVRSKDNENRNSYKKNENANNFLLRKSLNGPSENHENQENDGKEGVSLYMNICINM